MTSPDRGGGNAYHIIFCVATSLEFGEMKVISEIRKVNKFGMNESNTFGVM